ncbi:HlyD family secretion protein [Paraferrimonas haliotis]|uniref:HlyD family secretion protein n=1 Tax=Paraferrimonas haliotis TaxID=2013866 RepID=UPI000BA9412F|nr:efflux RND transporter periplasmic adaptor subunit [Paraferrimonas haliotis]
MDLLLILTYTGICVAIFKAFNIPLNKWTVPTAILGGIILIGSLLLLMNYNHPYTKFGREFFVSTPIMPAVRGVVVDVPVKPNTQLRKGDVLFKLDQTPFIAALAQKEAALADAELQLLQLEASYESAKATVAKATAEKNRTQDAYERYEAGHRKGGANSPFTDLELDNRRQVYLAANASLASALAQQERARVAFEGTINGENPIVARAKADVAKAQYDLDQTVVRAPSNGFVTQMLLRPGMVVVPMPLRPAMVFVQTDERVFAGAFWQNSLLRIKEGSEAEVIFPALPGRVFKARVTQVIPAMSEAELQASGSLAGTQRFIQHSRPIVLFELDEEHMNEKLGLPLGLEGEVAIYSDHFTHVSIIRKVLLRMGSWLNYLFA